MHAWVSAGPHVTGLPGKGGAREQLDMSSSEAALQSCFWQRLLV